MSQPKDIKDAVTVAAAVLTIIKTLLEIIEMLCRRLI